MSSIIAVRIVQTHRDRVARQARLGAGDHPLLAEQAVQQRGFAGVWSADDGELQRPLSLPPPVRLGGRQAIGDFAHQVGQALAVLGRDGDRLAQAERICLQRRGRRRRGPPPCWRPQHRAADGGAASRRNAGRPARCRRARRSRTGPGPRRETAVSDEARIRPASVSGAASSSPAVSTSRTSRPRSMAAPPCGRG